MAPGGLCQVVLAKTSASASTQSISHWGNQRVNRKYLNKNEIRNTTIQNYEVQQKQFQKGSL